MAFKDLFIKAKNDGQNQTATLTPTASVETPKYVGESTLKNGNYILLDPEYTIDTKIPIFLDWSMGIF